MTQATLDPQTVDHKEVKVGDLMSFTYWARVTSVKGFGQRLGVVNIDNDEEFVVQGKELIEVAKSADQHSESKMVTKTQIVDILANAKDVPLTVTFRKQSGAFRTLRGRLIGVDKKNLGYIDVEDLDKDAGDRFRLVDCRTIKSLIVNGVRYTVK